MPKKHRYIVGQGQSSKWTAKLRKSISGFALVAVKKNGGKYLKRPKYSPACS